MKLEFYDEPYVEECLAMLAEPNSNDGDFHYLSVELIVAYLAEREFETKGVPDANAMFFYLQSYGVTEREPKKDWSIDWDLAYLQLPTELAEEYHDIFLSEAAGEITSREAKIYLRQVATANQ